MGKLFCPTVEKGFLKKTVGGKKTQEYIAATIFHITYAFTAREFQKNTFATLVTSKLECTELLILTNKTDRVSETKYFFCVSRSRTAWPSISPNVLRILMESSVFYTAELTNLLFYTTIYNQTKMDDVSGMTMTAPAYEFPSALYNSSSPMNSRYHK